MTTQPDRTKDGFTFEDTAIALGISPDRWDEPLIREGIAFLNRAEELQLDLSVPLPGMDSFGAADCLMRCVCSLLKDMLKGETYFRNYVQGKANVGLGFYNFEVRDKEQKDY